MTSDNDSPRIQCRPIRPGEESAASSLVLRVFDKFVAPLYSEQGIREFADYADAEALRCRWQAAQIVLVAIAEGKMVGMIEVRDCSYIALLFVDGAFQRRGVGRGLIARAVEVCRSDGRELLEISVHAASNAVEAYERVGFRQTDAEPEVNGVRFVPMVLVLSNATP